MFNISYTLQVTISNTLTNELKTFNKSISTSLDIPNDQLYDNIHKLSEGYILDYFKFEIDKYKSKNNLNDDNIIIETYEIVSNTDNVTVFFENPENPNEFTLFPVIKAYIEPKKQTIPTPTLTGKLISQTTIMWIFDDEEQKNYAHFIIDNDDNIIAQLPIGINYYIDTNLQELTNYTRRVIAYGYSGTSKPSNPVTIMTGKNIKEENLKTYDEKRNDIYDKTPLNVINTPLKAFKSGVGDFNDCLITKPSDVEFYEKYNLYAKLYGHYYKKEKRYDEVKFAYRYKTQYKYKKKIKDGYVHLQLFAYPIENITFRIYKYKPIPVTVNYKITTSVKVNVNSTNENGEPTTQDILRNYTSQTFSYTVNNNITYTPGSVANIEPIKRENKIKLSNQTLYEMIKNMVDSDPTIADYNSFEILNINILDDYYFNSTDNKYNKNASRDFYPGGLGTFIITADVDNVTGYNKNSYIYAYGYCEAQLFHNEKTISKSISYLNGNNVTLLSSSELNFGSLKNIADSGYTISEDGATVIVEVLNKDKDLVISQINVNNSNVVTGTAPLNYKSEILTYEFSNDDDITNILFKDIIEGLYDDVNKKYIFKLNILDKTNNTYINGNPVEIKTYEYTNNVYQSIKLTATEYEIEVTDEQVYPTYENEPLFASVNGVFNTDNSYSGKKDYTEQAFKFTIPSYAYNVEYFVDIESINPNTAFVSVKFKNEIDMGVSNVNGDQVTFTSDSITYYNKEYKDILEIYDFTNLELFDLYTKNLKFTITKPELTDEQNRLFTKYTLDMSCNNPDVRIINYTKEIEFDADNKAIINTTIKGQLNTISMWNPRIHNGYYYLNQQEYYLYSEHELKGELKPVDVYKYGDVNLIIKVDLKKESNIIEAYDIIKEKSYELLKYDMLKSFKYDNGYILPLPNLDTKYYKEFSDSYEYLSPLYTFPYIVSEYNEINWNDVIPANTSLEIYIRAYDYENGVWSDWERIYKNSTPTTIPKSNVIQFKAKLKPYVVQSSKQEILETECCYEDYKFYMSENESYNVIIAGDVINLINTNAKGEYVSKVIDYGTNVNFNIRTYNEGEVKIYVAYSNNYDSITSNPQWKEVDEQNTITNYRYIKYKVVLYPTSKVNLLFKRITTPVTTYSLPKFGRIRIKAKYNPEPQTHTITKAVSATVLFDNLPHEVINNLREYIQEDIINAGFSIDNIVNINIESKTENIDVIYDLFSMPTNETATMEKIFNEWYRFSHDNTNNQPASPTEVNAWEYNAATNEVKCLVNSTTYIGFISGKSYKKYIHQANLYSTDGDDDTIAIVIAYAKDQNGTEHTLSAIRTVNRDQGHTKVETKNVAWGIVYDYNKSTEKLIIDGTSTVVMPPTQSWSSIPNGTTVKIIRDDDLITVYTSQFNTKFIDDTTKLEINLNNYPELAIFKGPKQYGYACLSQNKSSFRELQFINKDAVDTKVQVKSRNAIYDTTLTPQYVIFKNNTCELSPLPQQFSPIILQDDELGVLKYVPFVDEQGVPTLYNSETFVSKNQRTFTLEYNNIDINTLEVYLNDRLVDLSEYSITNNILEFNNYIAKDNIINVKYKLRNSYCVNFDIDNNKIYIYANADKQLEKTRVIYETNLIDNKRPLRHISLNPIYNTNHKGFIYISYDINKPKKINIYTNPTTLKSGNIDNTNVIVEVLDEYNNPVEGELVEIICQAGTVDNKELITDVNGIVKFRYYSALAPCVDNINVKCKNYNLSQTISIHNI